MKTQRKDIRPTNRRTPIKSNVTHYGLLNVVDSSHFFHHFIRFRKDNVLELEYFILSICSKKHLKLDSEC
jgi:hypothetical protein